MSGSRGSSGGMSGRIPPPPLEGVPVDFGQVIQTLSRVMETQQAQLERYEHSQDQLERYEQSHDQHRTHQDTLDEQSVATRQIAEAALHTAAGARAPREDRSLASFKELSPPMFAGACSPMEAEEWLMSLRRLFTAEGYSDENKLRFAVIQLHGAAVYWWESEVRAMEAAHKAVTWEVFQVRFLEHYFPVTVCAQLADEFKWIEQGDQTVLEYEQMFARLSRYAPQLVHTDADRARHFLQGLRSGIREDVDKLMLSTYAETVVRAKHIEKVNKGVQDRKSGLKRLASSFGPFSSGSPGSVQMSAMSRQGKKFLGNCSRCGMIGHMAETCRRSVWYSVAAPARAPGSATSSVFRPAPSGPPCFQCGKPGHFVRDCRSSDRLCFTCGLPDHLSYDCTDGHRGSSVSRGGGRGGRPAVEGRVFAITQKEVKFDPSMEEESNAYYVVRKGNIVGIYKSLSDCQAQVGSSVCDPPVSVYKGYSLSKETEEYLTSRGLKDALYSLNAVDMKEDLFSALVPCPFLQPNGQAFTGDKSPKGTSGQKRPAEKVKIEDGVGSKSRSIEPLMKQPKTGCSERTCIIEFDGASKGNPGKAGAGAILRTEEGIVISRVRQGLGVVTNNVAEYRACILGLKYALKKGFKKVRVQGDSMLVCMQVTERWQIKNQNMADLCKEAKELKNKFSTFNISHVRREFNSDADAQANIAVDLAPGEITEEHGDAYLV